MNGPIFVIGAAITDLLGFPPGEIVVGESMPGVIRRAPGGVGRNVAENLVRLGLPTELITVFGDDPFGRGLAAHARRAGIGVTLA